MAALFPNDNDFAKTEWSDLMKDQDVGIFLCPFIDEIDAVFQKLKAEVNKVIHSLKDLELKKMIAHDLGRAIYPIISRPMIWEYTVYKKHFKKNISFNEFVEALAENTTKEILKRKYPVMDSMVNRLLINYQESQSEFLKHLANDYDDILRTFRKNRVMLCEVKSAGDSHSGGRRTISAKFQDENNNDFLLIYKPRPIHLDKAFNNYLEFLGTSFDLEIFKPIKVLDNDSHGWIEHISRKSVDAKSIENYFERLGYLLCVIYSLNGSDIHYENLIAHGEYPVVIDLECLFTTPRNEDDVNDIHWPNVDDTSIIPMARSKGNGTQAFDISAMKQENESVLHLKHFVIDGVKENNPIARKKGSVIIPQDNVLEVVGGSKTINPNDYIESVINGFKSCYMTIESNKEEIVQYIGNNFQKMARRILYRPTLIYDRLMKESYHPRLLSNVDQYKNYFSTFNETSKNQLDDKILSCEWNDMLEGDIPCFFSITDNSLIMDSNFMDTGLRENITGMERVINKTRSMCESDMGRQQEIIRVSMGEAYG